MNEFDTEPTLDDLEELDDPLDDIDDLLDGVEDDLYPEDVYEPEPYESLDALRNEEYEADGSYYRQLGIGWDEV